jgi:RimJ/RimL family protein N-acetyltransferase
VSTWIETPRLVIRTFEPRDAEAWIAMVNDPEVARYLPPTPAATMQTFAEGSWRIMEKAGMRYEGLVNYYGLAELKKYVADREWWKPPHDGA